MQGDTRTEWGGGLTLWPDSGAPECSAFVLHFSVDKLFRSSRARCHVKGKNRVIQSLRAIHLMHSKEDNEARPHQGWRRVEIYLGKEYGMQLWRVPSFWNRLEILESFWLPEWSWERLSFITFPSAGDWCQGLPIPRTRRTLKLHPQSQSTLKIIVSYMKSYIFKLNTVTCTCNPSTWAVIAKGSWVQIILSYVAQSTLN